jgi:hypothetical protein
VPLQFDVVGVDHSCSLLLIDCVEDLKGLFA